MLSLLAIILRFGVLEPSSDMLLSAVRTNITFLDPKRSRGIISESGKNTLIPMNCDGVESLTWCSLGQVSHGFRV